VSGGCFVDVPTDPLLLSSEEIWAVRVQFDNYKCASKWRLNGTTLPKIQIWKFANFAVVQSIARIDGLNMKSVFTRIRTPKMDIYVLRVF
jgi:hypothetical protein